jgi:hypothetical protein
MSIVNRTALTALSLRWLEFFLFAGAFALVIPAVPSNEGEVYSLTPTLIIGSVLLAGSLALSIYRKAETLFFAALKLVFYAGLAWVVHARVWTFQ